MYGQDMAFFVAVYFFVMIFLIAALGIETVVKNVLEALHRQRDI